MTKKIILLAVFLLQLCHLSALNKGGIVTKTKFIEEEVLFMNKGDSVVLSGTITYPKSGTRFPAIILISGSGPSDRDETVFGKHKPFKVIAEYLSARGYAVLRYDDRGCGRSKGVRFPRHTSADLMGDVLSAVAFLKTKNNVVAGKIGLIGHSEGGMIAAMVAKNSKDVAFVISLAGAGCKIEDLMQQQNRSLLTSFNKTFVDHYIDLCYKPIVTELISGKDSSTTYKNICSVFSGYHKMVPDSEYKTFIRVADTLYAQLFMFQMYNPWFRYFLAYDPPNDWKEVRQPVLALNGTKDVQVDADQNLACITEGLTKANNKNFKIVKLKGYNHMFQKAKTGAVQEYVLIDEAFSKDALKIMLKWLNELP